MEKMEDRLRILRKKNDLTQENLSLQLKVSRQTISNWERGFSQPDAENLQLLADFYHVPVSYLIDGNLPDVEIKNGITETESETQPTLENKKLSLLKLLTVASFVTPLAAFGLLFVTNEYKDLLVERQYKIYSGIGFSLAIINLLLILFVFIDLLSHR